MRHEELRIHTVLWLYLVSVFRNYVTSEMSLLRDLFFMAIDCLPALLHSHVKNNVYTMGHYAVLSTPHDPVACRITFSSCNLN